MDKDRVVGAAKQVKGEFKRVVIGSRTDFPVISPQRKDEGTLI